MIDPDTMIKFHRPGEGIAVITMGSHLQGYVDVPYLKLVAIFGDPTGHASGDGKVDVEWSLRFEDGTIATIYNYKNGKAYLGRKGLPVNRITHWNIGGFSLRAVTCVSRALAQIGNPPVVKYC